MGLSTTWDGSRFFRKDLYCTCTCFYVSEFCLRTWKISAKHSSLGCKHHSGLNMSTILLILMCGTYTYMYLAGPWTQLQYIQYCSLATYTHVLLACRVCVSCMLQAHMYMYMYMYFCYNPRVHTYTYMYIHSFTRRMLCVMATTNSATTIRSYIVLIFSDLHKKITNQMRG